MKLKYLKDVASKYATTLHQRDFRHVSIILQKGTILAIGINRRRTHPIAHKLKYNFNEPHSELDALRQVRKDMRHNLTLVNFRFNRRGDMKKSNPCSKCINWCDEVFDRIWASQDDGTLQRLK